MNSRTLYAKFIEQVLKEEKIKTSKKDREYILNELYNKHSDDIIFEAHDAQTDFVC